MGGPGGVRVQGLRETRAAFEAARADLDDLDDVMGQVAATAAETLRPLVPVRTRALANSVRGGVVKGQALVTIGNARADYAGPVLARSRAVARTDAVMETRAPQIFEAAWGRIAAQNGLTT